MTLHFSYGANMDRAAMAARCAGAKALGPAVLHGYRFLITTDGYASLGRAPGAAAHGVLWRLTPRDLAALNAFESIDSGLYRRAMLPVRMQGRRLPALVYLGRGRGEGRPRPGYLGLILQAARDWKLPEDYIRGLERWAPVRDGRYAPDIGDIA